MLKTLLVALVAAVSLNTAQAREYISIAGSSTVFPFATIVAEQMGRNAGNKTPVVESGGSSVGKKGVCDGIGTQFIDIGNASSRMKTKELAYCDKNGVAVTEIKVGYDGIVVASSKQGTQLNITRAELGMALTAKVPAGAAGQNYNQTTWIDNPFTHWNQINPELPAVEIRVYGPPTTSGTRASFAEMINQKGYCAKDKLAKKASAERGDKKGKKCRAMRTDGAYIEAGEQDNLIVQKLQEDPKAYGIFGFSYLDQNSDTLQGAVLDGVAPTFEAIGDGSYKASRALYFYIKHAHIGVVPGLNNYMKEWTKHWEAEQALSDAGMIPLGEVERLEMIARMKDLPVLKADDLK